MMSPRSLVAPDTMLARALELLRQVPLKNLNEELRVRIRSLLDDSDTPVEPSEAQTQPERPRLFPLYLLPAERLVLERALKSPRISEMFTGSVRDFILVAARGYSYQPTPDLKSLAVALTEQGLPIPYAESEVTDLRVRALEAGVSHLDKYMKGCAFAFLAQLQARYSDDGDLNAHVRLPAVPVVRF